VNTSSTILVGSRSEKNDCWGRDSIPLFPSLSPPVLSNILVVDIGNQRLTTQQILGFSFTLIFFATMFLSRSLLSSVRSVAASQARFYHASSLSLAKLNLKGLAERVNLDGKNVLVRVDLNVPLAKVRSV
jgi:hypothetical protein